MCVALFTYSFYSLAFEKKTWPKVQYTLVTFPFLTINFPITFSKLQRFEIFLGVQKKVVKYFRLKSLVLWLKRMKIYNF